MQHERVYRSLSPVNFFTLVLFIFASFFFGKSAFSSFSSFSSNDWIDEFFYVNPSYKKNTQFCSRSKFNFFVRNISPVCSPYKRKYKFVLPKTDTFFLLNKYGKVFYLVDSCLVHFDYRNYLHTPHFLSGVARRARSVVSNALKLIGIRYLWGGNSPERGLDCSGFVKYVIDNTLGSNLPRRAAEMSNLGQKVGVTDDLQAGDLVFFNTRHRPYSHVGIYISANMFAHAPSTGNKIRVDSIKNSYWSQRYNGARRLDIISQED